MLIKTYIKLIQKDKINREAGGCSSKCPDGSLITKWQDAKDLSEAGKFTFIVSDKDDSDYIWNYVKEGDIVPVLLHINCKENSIVILYFVSNVLNQDNLDKTYVKASGELGLLSKCRRCGDISKTDEVWESNLCLRCEYNSHRIVPLYH